MKEAYFSPDTIQRKAGEMLAGLHISARKPELVPEKSALLILDMQDYFLESDSHACVPSAKAILPGLRRIIAAYAQRENPIIFTQHINTSEDAAMMGVWWHELINADHPLKGISSKLDTSLGTVMQKTQYDALFGTDLGEMLSNSQTTQVVICGVMTHLCCESTARSAFMHGYEVFFTVDGTATYNRKFHLATLSTLTHGFARPMLVDEVIAACEGRQ